MKKILIFIFSIFAVNLTAAEGGKVGFTFLKIGVDARAAAMGEANTALAKDASATFWNPAGLAESQSNSAILTHNAWIQDISHNFASVQLIRGVHNLAFSLNMISVPGIELRDETPTEEPTGTVSANNLYIGASYATRLTDAWSIGGQLKYMFEKYYLEEASGIAFDVGLLRKNIIHNMDWGFSLQNVGKMAKLRSADTDLPVLLRTGISYRLPWKIADENILGVSDIAYVFNDAFRVNLGGEVTLLEMLALRLGYIFGNDSYSFTAGFGLHFDQYQLSYAFVPFKYNLGNSHRFSFNIYFN